jgi:hypothetical protein
MIIYIANLKYLYTKKLVAVKVNKRFAIKNELFKYTNFN